MKNNFPTFIWQNEGRKVSYIEEYFYFTNKYIFINLFISIYSVLLTLIPSNISTLNFRRYNIKEKLFFGGMTYCMGNDLHVSLEWVALLIYCWILKKGWQKWKLNKDLNLNWFVCWFCSWRFEKGDDYIHSTQVRTFYSWRLLSSKSIWKLALNFKLSFLRKFHCQKLIKFRFSPSRKNSNFIL